MTKKQSELKNKYHNNNKNKNTTKNKKQNLSNKQISKKSKQINNQIKKNNQGIELKRNISDNTRKNNKKQQINQNNSLIIPELNNKKSSTYKKKQIKINKKLKSQGKFVKNKSKKQQSQQFQEQNQIQLQDQIPITKLQRGYKLCQKCQTILNIHKYVCTQCGFIHNMKKHKLDVMKNINKATPKIIKSVVQSHQFNVINHEYKHKYNKQTLGENKVHRIIQFFEKSQFKKVENKSNVNQENKIVKNIEFIPTTLPNFTYYKSNHPITCLELIKSSIKLNQQIYILDILLFVQSVSKTPKPFHSSFQEDYILLPNNEKHKLQLLNQKKTYQNNQITRKSLKLQNYHQIGHQYQGQSLIKFYFIKQKLLNEPIKLNKKNQQDKILPQKYSFEYISQIQINFLYHIQKIKSFSNKIAILTGTKQVHLMNINFYKNQNKLQNYLLNIPKISVDNQNESKLKNYGVIKLKNDQFTTIQWLKLFSKKQKNHQNNVNQKQKNIFLTAGTLNGHIHIYSISQSNEYSIYRSIITAHNQLINCLVQCPLNNYQFGIFASGSHDGSIKIWSVYQKLSIYQFQASNRKIQQLYWDSGAKYLLIVRDQTLQSCYLGCFYSINKNDVPITLSNTIDFRLIRNSTYYHADPDNLIGYSSFNSSFSPFICYPLNSKIVLMFNSRNGFLKILESQELRKTSLKRKKSKKNQSFYSDYKINLVDIAKLRQREQNKQEMDKLQVIKITGNKIKHNINIQRNILKNGIKNTVINQIRPQIMIQENQDEDRYYKSNESQNESIQNLQINGNNKAKIQISSHSLHPTIMINHKPHKIIQQQITLRKSTRARKPIQYIFNDYVDQDQKQIKQNKNKKKKKKDSEQEDYQDSQIKMKNSQYSSSEQDQQNIYQQKKSKTERRIKNYRINQGNDKKVKNKLIEEKNEKQDIIELTDIYREDFYNIFPRYSCITMLIPDEINQRDLPSNNEQQNNNIGQQKNQKQKYKQKIKNDKFVIVFIASFTGQLIKAKINIQN